MDNEFYFNRDFEKTENWNKLLDLTHTVWRVADLTIESDFLKARIKQSSCDILMLYPNAIFERKGVDDLVKNINTHMAVLSLAQKVSRSKEINFLILRNEYKKIIFSLSQKLLDERSDMTVGNVTSVAVEPVAADENEAGKPPSPTPVIVKKSVKEDPINNLNERQAKIVQFFQKKKLDKVKLKDITQFFPSLTDRTIRNDLKDLCEKRIVSRTDGHGQASFYYLIRK